MAEKKVGHIKSLIFASSKTVISCKLFLKGEFNAWNRTERFVANVEEDKSYHKKVRDLFDKLMKQAEVEKEMQLEGLKVECTFDGDQITDIDIIK